MDFYFALLCGATFLLAPLGLVFQIKKIWQRGTPPTSVNRFPLLAHIARFSSWGMLGAISLDSDPAIGWMFIVTRIPAATLAAFSLLQITEPRPRVSSICWKIVFPIVGLLCVCGLCAAIPAGEVRATISISLKTIVAISFISLTLILVPRKILYILKHGSFGMLRLFELGILPNFLLTFVLGFMAKDRSLGVLMIACYGLAIIMQVVLVVLLERGRILFRREQTVTKR
jgi:hypothetical protein